MTRDEFDEFAPTESEYLLARAREYASACIPDLTLAISDRETPDEVADALLALFPPDFDRDAARAALLEWISYAEPFAV